MLPFGLSSFSQRARLLISHFYSPNGLIQLAWTLQLEPEAERNNHIVAV
jgi:hypothetical protein